MRDFLAVAVGGMVGSLVRYAVNLGTARLCRPEVWPLATLIVNVAGCFAIGILSALAKRHGWLDTGWELAVRVGFLGALTTFSSFGLEVIRLGHEGRWLAAASVVALNVFLSLGAVVLGERLVS